MEEDWFKKIFTYCFFIFFPEAVGTVCRVCKNMLLSCQVLQDWWSGSSSSVLFKWWQTKVQTGAEHQNNLFCGKEKTGAEHQNNLFCVFGGFFFLIAEKLLSSSVPSFMLLHDFSSGLYSLWHSKPCHDRVVTKHPQSPEAALAANHSSALSRISRGWILVCISFTESPRLLLHLLVFSVTDLSPKAPSGALWHPAHFN